SAGGRRPLTLASGETRRFLEDGDTVIMRAHCRREGFVPIGFGECCATIAPALWLWPGGYVIKAKHVPHRVLRTFAAIPCISPLRAGWADRNHCAGWALVDAQNGSGPKCFSCNGCCCITEYIGGIPSGLGRHSRTPGASHLDKRQSRHKHRTGGEPHAPEPSFCLALQRRCHPLRLAGGHAGRFAADRG